MSTPVGNTHHYHQKSVNLPRQWSQLSYAGEERVPEGVDPTAGSWPLFFLRRDTKGRFVTPDGVPITFEIQQPDNFNFNQQLIVVQQTLASLTPTQKKIAEYWGDGPATKQWTPIIDRLIDTYGFTPVRAARVLAAVQSGINDAFVVTWYYKYLWDVARPNQLDQKLVTFICTPKFPSYPSGHSVVAGTAEVILSYFFPPESQRLQELAEEDSLSRLYGGVHFPADLSEGLRLGRQIGRIIVNILAKQFDENQTAVDVPVTQNRNAQLPPPPYEQVIPFPSRVRDCDLPLLPECSWGQGKPHVPV
ncbi:vanadium-dependent haloperoxidase [Heliomicrobium gestii]|nr:vanadium-dependent haloperoxidase [Heliomicrobium gestii]MBM7865971.1 membrane-associated phospholipid phosphatase [Heliomicrobium gestii]